MPCFAPHVLVEVALCRVRHSMSSDETGTSNPRPDVRKTPDAKKSSEAEREPVASSGKDDGATAAAETVRTPTVQRTSGSWRFDASAMSDKFEADSPAQVLLSKDLAEYHNSQRELLAAFRTMDDAMHAEVDAGTEALMSAEETSRAEARREVVTRAINTSFVCNVLLFFVKIVAAVSSGSISVVASTVDSGLDLTTGAIIFITQKVVRRKSPYRYPQGKTRLEPLGVIVFACVMGVSMLGLLQEAVAVIVKNIATPDDMALVNMDGVTAGILGGNIVLKIGLFIFCRRADAFVGGNPMVEAYGDDHRNDVVSNILVVTSTLIAASFPAMWWIDPAFAICMCVYIVLDWISTAKEQIQKLAGLSAGPEFLSKVTYLACNHDVRVEKIDTVRAYHFGLKYLVECDIVLPEDMPLKEAHDIGEQLQIKIEKMEDVERAFVHLDYEWDHKAEHGDPYA